MVVLLREIKKCLGFCLRLSRVVLVFGGCIVEGVGRVEGSLKWELLVERWKLRLWVRWFRKGIERNRRKGRWNFVED